MAHEIFICYRSQDTDGEALLIASHLRTIFGEGHVFWAPASIRGGQDFVVESTSKAEGAWIVLAIIGPNWGCDLAEGSPVVVAELRAAISREVRIFPVLVRRESLEDVPLPDLAFLETTDGKQWPTGLNHHELDGEACRLAHRLVQAEPRLQQFTNHSWGGWPVTLDLAPHPEWSIEVEEGDHLFGRDELDELERRLLEPGGDLRFVAVHGEGGLGKSTVAEALWRRAKRRTGLDGSFDLLAWISLKVAPRSATSVAECIRESLPVEFARRGRALDDLGRLVSTKRCLMVIDNLETTMEARGKFSDEYADFDELLAVLEAETSRSVAIVTSRALPKVVEAGPGVKVVKLPALDAISAVKVFRRDHMSLVESYGSDSWLRVAGKLWGNPYLCVLVARFISAKIESGEYGKGPENWLEDPAVPEKVDDIYRWHWDQFEKAGASGRFEREILLWLTINRDPMSKEELLHDLWSPDSKKRFDTSRDGLDARFPIQTSEEESSGRRVLTVHSYILDFSVERVVDISNDELSRRFGVSLGLGRLFRDQVVEEVSAQLQMGLDEIRSEVGNALATPGPTGVVLIDHCLVKAASPTHVRRFQRETFLVPVVESLRARRPKTAGDHVRMLLRLCALEGWGGYLGGNLLEILRELEGGELSDVDAPGLFVRQADLRHTWMQNVMLRDAVLQDVRMTQPVGEIRALDLSSDGNLLVAGDSRGSAMIWRLGDEVPLCSHSRHGGAKVRAVAFSCDGSTIASACGRGGVWIWSSWEDQEREEVRRLLSKGKSICELHDHRELRSLVFDRDGNLITAAECPTVWLHRLDGSGSRQIFDLGTTSEPKKNEPRRVNVVTYDRRRHVVYAGTNNGGVYAVDLTAKDSWSELGRGSVPCHQNQVWALSVSPCGTMLGTGSADGWVKTWSIPGYELVDEFYHGGEVFGLAFTHDSARIVSGNEDASVAVWHLGSRSRERLLRNKSDQQGHELRVRAVVAGKTPMGSIYATGGFDRKLIIWGENGRRLSIVEGYAKGLTALATSRQEVYAGYENGRVLAWEVDSGVPRGRTVCEHEGPVLCVEVDERRRRIFSGGRDGKVMAMSLDSHEEEEIGTHYHWVWSLALAPGGEQLASCSEDGRVLLWDLATGGSITCDKDGDRGPRSEARSHCDRVRVVRYHPDPSLDLVASGGYDNKIRFWDAKDGRSRGFLEGANDWVFALDFSSDGFLAATWGRGLLAVWSVEQLLGHDGPLSELECHRWEASKDRKRILELRFLPDGRLLSAGEDGFVSVWSGRDEMWRKPKRMHSFGRHEGIVNGLALLGNGHVVSGDVEGVGWVWSPNEKGSMEGRSFAPDLPYQGLDLSGASRRDASTTDRRLSSAELDALETLGATVR